MVELSLSQKILVGVGDAIAAFGLVLALIAMQHGSYEKILFLGGGASLVGLVVVFIALFYKGDKPKQLFMIISIMYASLAFLILILGGVEESPQISMIGVATMIVSIMAVNLAVFRPNDLKLFNTVNIIAAFLGLVFVLVGTYSHNLKSPKSFAAIGAVLLAVSSASTSIGIYKKE